MPLYPLFSGLVVDEYDRPVEVSYVGEEPCYVVDDSGFRRHIPSAEVDRQVIHKIKEQISGNEKILSEQAAKMLGQEDIFTRAIIENQLEKFDDHFEALLKTGIPEESRAYMGMVGFRIVINVHGEVLDFKQPGQIFGEGDE